MATQKQIAANRRNAQKFTGPRTPAGKAAVRLNALIHGLRARTVVLPGENQNEFDQLSRELHDQFQPVGPDEKMLVEQMGVAYWKLARVNLAERCLFQIPTQFLRRANDSDG